MGKGRNSLIGAVQAHLRQGAGNVVPVRIDDKPTNSAISQRGANLYVSYPDGQMIKETMVTVVGSCATIMAAGYDQTPIKQQIATALNLSTINGIVILQCTDQSWTLIPDGKKS
jgi:hypothetical protein